MFWFGSSFAHLWNSSTWRVLFTTFPKTINYLISSIFIFTLQFQHPAKRTKNPVASTKILVTTLQHLFEVRVAFAPLPLLSGNNIRANKFSRLHATGKLHTTPHNYPINLSIISLQTRFVSAVSNTRRRGNACCFYVHVRPFAANPFAFETRTACFQRRFHSGTFSQQQKEVQLS